MFNSVSDSRVHRTVLLLVLAAWGAPACKSDSPIRNNDAGGGAGTSGAAGASGGAGVSGGAGQNGGGGVSGDAAAVDAAIDPNTPNTESVLQRNKQATRAGHYRQAELTKAASATMTLDATWTPAITGNVYAQPLYVEDGPAGKGIFIVVTEDNNVYAIAEADGATVWTKNLGMSAGNTGAGCGGIKPYGITGTPVIDHAARTLYLEASVGNAQTIMQHQVHALSIDDGAEKDGFPFDPSTVSFKGLAFAPTLHNQRGALLLLGDVLYVPYGGHGGDCGDYRGWVMGIPVGHPAGAQAFATGARGGGIWGAGGLASDGSNIFTATGNTFGTKIWAQGEAVFRLQAGATFSGQPADYFVPSDWLNLDNADQDVGGSGPILVDVPGANPSALVVALGKNGVAYLLDRNNLGGMGKGNGTTGEGLASARVHEGSIVNAAATYTTAAGTFVVFHGARNRSGVGCPAGQAGDLVALKIGPTAPPTISVAWCAVNQGEGSPIVTTTDGSSEAVVWTAGAELSQQLHAFDGETGAAIFAGGSATDRMPNTVHRFQSPIAVHGRILVAADNALYAFKHQ